LDAAERRLVEPPALRKFNQALRALVRQGRMVLFGTLDRHPEPGKERLDEESLTARPAPMKKI
jgi:hypothetical protein